MGGRFQASFALAGALILAACGEKASEAPTAPEFAATKNACNFTNVAQLTKNEFGNNSTEAGYATDMKNAGTGTDDATYFGYLILASVESKFSAQDASNTIDPTNAASLTIALLPCMKTGTTSYPSQTTIAAALKFTGAYGVRGFGTTADTRSLRSHDGIWILEPPSGSDWQSITTTAIASLTNDARIVDALLAYGVPSTTYTQSNFTGDSSVSSGVFEWATTPGASFTSSIGGVLVGECVSPSGFLQHNPVNNGAEVLGFITPSCYQTIAMGESPPRTFAERVLRLFAPTPAYATLLTTTGSGGSKGSLSPFSVIGPQATVLVSTFKWNKSGYTVNAYISPTVAYDLKSGALSPFLQPYILVWLEATNNQGVNVKMCNNWAYTTDQGNVSFPFAYLNKAGGYTITTKTAGAFSLTTNNGVSVTVPTVPPSAPQSSPLINVKNDVTKSPPDNCPNFTPVFDASGNLTNPPDAPGPNG
jgi:hypothetical protein